MPQSATKHDVKNALQNPFADDLLATQPWRYDRDSIEDVQTEQDLLVRVIIGKVVTVVEEIDAVLAAIPVESVGLREFNDEMWMEAAIEELKKKEAVKGLVTWKAMKGVAVDYVEMKKRIGRWDTEWEGEKRVPMLDLMTGEEVVG
ncbi:hypothetical protein CC80DRAFT_491167 [Byssothecium circinans]|uniref:Uncharacterized protein n=1 Tax=Byssothecium circinans TaxID=147558 RepID=A0A6A5TYV2_9PLEO|nr:hypothetical protein CC80DRAFT_491167 [Byssothecium circinans]